MNIYKQLAAIASIAVSITGVEAANATTTPTISGSSFRKMLPELIVQPNAKLNADPAMIAQRVATRTYDGNGTLMWRDARGYRNETIDKISIVNNQSRQVTLILQTRNRGQYAIEGRIGLVSDEGFRVVLVTVEGTEAEGKLFVGRNGEIRTIEPLAVGSDNQDFFIGFQPSDGDTPASDGRMTLYQEGRGLFSLAGRPGESVTRVSLVAAANQDVEIAMRGRDNRLLRFNGKLIRRNANTLDIQLTHSGSASARGTVRVAYGANNSIDTLSGNGTLDGQSFSMNFKGEGNQAGGRSPLSLSQDGRGVLALAGRENRVLTRASAILQADGDVQITFRDRNNRPLRFSGRAIRRNANTLDVRLTGSGDADATGTLNISYGANRSINSLKGNGTLDGQRFSITFNNSQTSTPNSINLAGNGSGLFSLAGRADRSLTRVRAIVRGDGNAEIAVRDRNNSSIRFSGRLMRRDAYSLEIRLTNSGDANATGVVNIEYAANNSINTLFADGTLDGQTFFINFSR